MNNEGKFWVSISIVFSIAIVFVVYFSTGYWKDYNGKILTLIENGVNPVSAVCAMQNDYGENPTCIVLAAKKNN